MRTVVVGGGIVGLAVAREVYGWRDKFAERVNRPPRFMMRDDLLVEVADETTVRCPFRSMR